MKKWAVVFAAASFIVSTPLASLAADQAPAKGKKEQATAQKEQAAAPQEKQGQGVEKGMVIREKVVDGVRVTFRMVSIKDEMKGMAMKGMKETHYIMVSFKDTKSGQPVAGGEVVMKLVGPDKAQQIKELKDVRGDFSEDFDMSKKGTYAITTKYRLLGGDVENDKFKYTVQ